VQGDRGYDSESYRHQCWQRGIEPKFAKQRTEHGSRLDIARWYVQRTLAWFKRYGKIRIRTEQRAENDEALVKLAACLICHRTL
jgi:IS5 family transposase